MRECNLDTGADKLRHPRSSAYSAEQVLRNKQQIWCGGACLHRYLDYIHACVLFIVGAVEMIIGQSSCLIQYVQCTQLFPVPAMDTDRTVRGASVTNTTSAMTAQHFEKPIYGMKVAEKPGERSIWLTPFPQQYAF